MTEQSIRPGSPGAQARCDDTAKTRPVFKGVDCTSQCVMPLGFQNVFLRLASSRCAAVIVNLLLVASMMQVHECP